MIAGYRLTRIREACYDDQDRLIQLLEIITPALGLSRQPGLAH